MTTQSPSSAPPAQISVDTERCLRAFTRAAISRLAEALKDQEVEWNLECGWERGSDAHFRERTKRRRVLWRTLTDGLHRSIPEYAACMAQLKSDVVVGCHLDRLVGTSHGACRIDSEDILGAAIYGSLCVDESLTFSEEQFNRTWAKLAEFFRAERIALKMVAPIPYLVIQDFPLRLNNELELDRLTEDEVTRCAQVGVLRPNSPRFPLIAADVAVGVHRTMFFPKLIRTGDEPGETARTMDEGSFGRRSSLRADLAVDDVLSAMRLFKHTGVRTAGYAAWADAMWLSAGTSCQVLRQWPYGGKYELSRDEVPQFLELWHLLEVGATRFAFSIHRFNLAFDRGLLADRIVDLVIAGESLFLGDLDVAYRGELRFRFALRAAKFIEHPNYREEEIYCLMQRAYDTRSAIVHGGSPKDTSLPNNESANLATFIDTIEELVRLGLRKALAMKEDGQKLRQSDYWLGLVLANPNKLVGATAPDSSKQQAD